MVKSKMDDSEREDAADGPVVSEGGHSPSTLSPGQATPGVAGAATLSRLAPGQRWSAARKREVVLRLMRGESAELLSRELGLPIFKLEQWRRKAEAALEGALKECEADPATGELAAAMRRIGELSMENELLRARLGALPQAAPALWPAGGRGDGRGDLPNQRPLLRRCAHLPCLEGAEVLFLRGARGKGGRRRGRGEPGTPWAEAGGVRPGATCGHPRRPRALALDRRGPPQGLGPRSEERRVGKECRFRRSPSH